MKSSQRILAVGAEPGSANTLGPILRKLSCPFLLLSGQTARQGFESYGLTPIVPPAAESREAADRLIEERILDFKPSLLICTTVGRQDTSFDHAAMRVAHKQGLRHIAILDSWMNLETRFHFDGGKLAYYPDLVAVPDNFLAQKLQELGIPEKHISITGHPYFDELEARNPEKIKKGLVLFLLQPLAGLVRTGSCPPVGYTETDVVNLLFSALKGNKQVKELILREHPRLNSEYTIPKGLSYKVSVSKDGDVWELVEQAELVIGMSSTVLVYSYLARVPTLVSQPNLLNQDPNILTERSIVPNCDTVEKLREKITKAFICPSFQEDDTKRKAFLHDGRCVQRVIELFG